MGLLDALFDPKFRQDVRRGLLDAGNRGAGGRAAGRAWATKKGLLSE